ncbi:hypothetical protein QWZ08_19305 [Ferruginibacter paludis]|uniref:hypothetical protein n=1 Tax=Ferruginibacter paludis TaxID=1310417 RepID=UPI0025B587F5|nr:hypothetical protein [Ferruginibacter paludis]MDN3657808.1 hypothetical protein [Ferruginibacter paludis]
MFSSITWGQYLIGIALLLLFYYVFVAFKYYKWEILGVIGIKKIDGSSVAIPSMAEFKSSMEGEKHEKYLPKNEQAVDISPLIQSFRDEIKGYLQDAVPWIEKQDLLDALKSITSKYPALKTADCLTEISTIILFEVNNTYPDIIEPNDIENLWQ